jgi:alkanesulfonate monooxygenase SsuD/methylene tetrahydromethanopterin reductase-like flavin-dependent oxidoreductase (luciferase family)
MEPDEPIQDPLVALAFAAAHTKRIRLAGEFVQFSGVNAYPRPVQRPLPVVIAGHSAAAHRRAARSGDGWYGFLLDLEQTAEQVDGLRRELRTAGRDIGELELTVSPSVRLDAETLDSFGRLGIDRIVLVPRPGSSLEQLEQLIRRNAPADA